MGLPDPDQDLTTKEIANIPQLYERGLFLKKYSDVFVSFSPSVHIFYPYFPPSSFSPPTPPPFFSASNSVAPFPPSQEVSRQTGSCLQSW